MIMGLRTELAAGDGFDWTQQGLVKSSTGGAGITARPVRPPPPPQQKQRQQQAAASQQQQGPQLLCPRCDSANTKFCYYNNYSRAQPRHFCKACRRHWTAGGTLRNVPVGGGRKAKRPKTSHPSATAAAAAVDDANTVMPASSSQLLSPLSFPPDFGRIEFRRFFSDRLSTDFLTDSKFPTDFRQISDETGGCSFSASAAFSPFLSLTGQEDLAAEIASDMGAPAGSTATPPTPWELLSPRPGPPTCSGGASGSPSSGLTSALDSSSSPSSGYWGSCWEDLSSLLSIDLEQHPPPAPADAAPPQHLYNFDLS